MARPVLFVVGVLLAAAVALPAITVVGKALDAGAAEFVPGS